MPVWSKLKFFSQIYVCLANIPAMQQFIEESIVDFKYKKFSDVVGKVFDANGDQKKAGVAKLISDKRGFEIQAVKRDKEGH